jgi:uncharacterized protein (DUF1501 family)
MPIQISRRRFLQQGSAAFTLGFAAPAFLSDLARAQGASSRNLVVLYLGGGNDTLSTLVPYRDAFYYSRRPTLAVPAASVLQIGTDAGGHALGLHPRLEGLRAIFNQGRLAFIQRVGYPNSSRSHFQGTDIWSTADPRSPQGPGWLGRYLDALPAPLDPLTAWNTSRETPHSLIGRRSSAPSIPDVGQYRFQTPNGGADADAARQAYTRVASHVPVDAPHLSLVHATALAAIHTIDRVAVVAGYRPTVEYPATGLAQALRAVAGALATGVGTQIFWVQTGGYDTHAQQGVNAGAGVYAGLMTTLDAALSAFHADLRNHGLLDATLVVLFSEFGRRVAENGSAGTDHGSGGLMALLGGRVRGGLYGTAGSLNPVRDNPALVNDLGDLAHETDFRSVYARVIDGWLGADSVALLGGDFRQGAPPVL